MAAERKLIKVQEGGLVSLPTGFGVKPGDVLEARETADGILLVLQNDPLTRALDGAASALRDAGVSLEELIDNSREIRDELWHERYEDKSASRKRR
jgi:hypothetical protein